MAAHLGLDCMNSAEVPVLYHPAQERADGHIVAGLRVPHLKRDGAPEILMLEARARHLRPAFHERNVSAQDIGAALLDPDVHVRGGRRNAGAEDPAAEAALFAGFVFGRGHCLFSILVGGGIWVMEDE